MNDKLVTIVVNCYNRADMVCTALDSVWNQTYRPIELIIVDDGSRDNSMEVIERWCKEHPDNDGFTTVAKTFSNGKLCVARNRGLAMAHGEYLQYVDDDDWLYPNAIEEKLLYAQKNPEKDLIVNQLDYLRNGSIINHTRITLPEHDENLIAWLLDHECLISPVLMFKTETLRRIGAWKEGLIFADDMEITLRLAILGGKFGIVNQHLSGYRIHNQARQCTTIRDRLSDDFCAKLYGTLFELCKNKKQDSEIVRNAFLEHYNYDAEEFIRVGRFNAAKQCILAKKSIGERLTFKDRLSLSFLGKIRWILISFFWKIRQHLKRLIKK